MLRNGVPGPGHFLGHLPRPQAPPDSGRIRGAQAPSLLLTFPDSQYPAPRDKRTVWQEGQTAGRRWPGGGTPASPSHPLLPRGPGLCPGTQAKWPEGSFAVGLFALPPLSAGACHPPACSEPLCVTPSVLETS